MTDKIETLGDATFKRLKAMILDGTLEPGTRLSEKKFADHLGVSRTPVREAIGQLVSEGLAKRSAGSAPVVSSVSLNEIMEILHVRSLLECEAARKAASIPPLRPIGSWNRRHRRGGPRLPLLPCSVVC